MLDEKDAVRIEYRTVQHKKGPYKQKIWIFLCDTCGKEMPKTKYGIKTHTGKCVKCVKQGGHKYQTLYNCMKSSVARTNSRWKYRKGIDVVFDLTFEQFLEFTDIGVCIYCDGPVEWREWSPGPYNLDRKDSSRGYTRDNVVVCCSDCNRMKMAWYSFEEFLALRKLLTLFRASNDDGKKELMYALVSWNDGIRVAP